MSSEESMSNRTSEFWGICCEGGKKYSQVVRQKFHMTMAALDPTVIPTSPVVSLMVDRGGCEYLLCSLKPGTLLQVNLNLYFDKGEKVTFSLVGKGKIHLSGYHIYDKNESVPTATRESETKVSSPTKPATSQKAKQKGSLNVAKKLDDVQGGKAASKKVKNVKKSEDNESDDSEDDDSFDDLEDDDDDDSSDDEESEEGTEDNKKDSNRLKSYKRLWSSLTQSDEEEEDDSEDSDEDTSEKNGMEFQKEKRPKKEKSKVGLNEKSAKITAGKSLDGDKSINKSPKQDLLNSSIGRTPMPQKKALKENMSNSPNAPTPKKVNFVDLESSDSDNEKDPSTLNATPSKAAEPSTPSSESKKKKKKKKKKNQSTPDDSNTASESPATPKGLSSASFNQKLPGGLEYEDIRVGNGPIAKKGRLVHVYYTGMLENNKVFDSREIGNKPFSFRLGSNQVIKGWDMAVEGMKVGGKRRMKIPPSLGYANKRTGPIPPNSTLYFTVELKAVS